jgi:hypothetical protein
LPIDDFFDCIPARTSVQALGVFFRISQTGIFCDTGNVKVFCRMVHPNVNIRRLDMLQMTDMDDVRSLKNAIMIDATKASETILNLNTKISFLPYKFCDDDPATANLYCKSHKGRSSMLPIYSTSYAKLSHPLRPFM